ncbi:MAG: amidohydrolase family protein [gamma proteobacterium symbiont of Bathyaustriella thionipta]|nr:amidohydrolase family protein [gamma proteobacterium symbiont of Bathyaustriella thionipta]MCU7949836.1 amidohydrolase family protein [gamma proteobacterium symbiont of Bathyaustriella thionipta]MCU7954092.1 amidohydrolase family protein [gamma proteobacterium symbiont of Bathyaustriella thionipta]MCU7956410.1 amidohydrolase family protein [gamma proteobacterium symbiont of Bathyaustriella thionipta]MCU7966701.1 amidohydrolase family protein [gamma proteobacterium symbiont of Bathyaustriella
MKKNFVITLVIIFTSFMFMRDNPMGALNPGVGKSIVDAHVHVAGLGYGDSGCFINEDMRNNIRFPFYLWAMGVTEEELIKHGDQILFKKLSDRIAQSETIKQSVILSMDAYIDHDDQLNRKETQLFVPNDYVAAQTALYDNLLFGASINPNRKDALQRLQKVKQQGALLIKWIPSIMNIDPSNPDYIPFYKMMAKLNIPLLTHTGMEKSFANARDELADPIHLKLPLEHGVTVIAAHIATTGESMGEDNFTRILPMIRHYPNLYVDVSSLTQINKLNYLGRALQEEGVTKKMIYGTDWPLQFFPLVSPCYHINHIRIKDAYAIGGIKNQWDRDVALKTAFGVPKAIFLRTELLLNKP